MQIRDFLSPQRVLLDEGAGAKLPLLRTLSALAASETKLDAHDLLERVLKREALGSTGVGRGIAFPHARLKGLKAPLGVLARLRHAIDFEAIDGEPVDIVFLLLLPEADQGEATSALACASRKLRDAKVQAAIRAARSGAELFAALNQGEAAS